MLIWPDPVAAAPLLLRLPCQPQPPARSSKPHPVPPLPRVREIQRWVAHMNFSQLFEIEFGRWAVGPTPDFFRPDFWKMAAMRWDGEDRGATG